MFSVNEIQFELGLAVILMLGLVFIEILESNTNIHLEIDT